MLRHAMLCYIGLCCVMLCHVSLCCAMCSYDSLPDGSALRTAFKVQVPYTLYIALEVIRDSGCTAKCWCLSGLGPAFTIVHLRERLSHSTRVTQRTV